jgi:hypothetical protein
MTKTKSYDLLRLAYHEAGHVVMAKIHGIPVRGVDITKQDYVERTDLDLPAWLNTNCVSESEYGRHFAEAVIMTYLAGAVSETLHAPTPSLHQGDFREAVSLASIFESGPTLCQYLKFLFLKTGQQLCAARTWSAVSAFAECLSARGSLAEYEIRRIFNARRRCRSPAQSIDSLELIDPARLATAASANAEK